MKRKTISIILAISVLIHCFVCCAVTASAASFSTQLKSEGFTDEYINALTELHSKYPEWTFKALKTGVKWEDAVSSERSYHSKQLIQKTSLGNTDFYCSCAACCKDGKYVIREGSSWVAASQSAVEYYMNPVNWLDEKHIFQFESIAYDSSQTTTGVEAILAPTWMSKSKITYKDTEGNDVTYKKSSGNTVKYSTAILDAAKYSGMSAYYIASKIVQEVGSKNATTGGACGTKLPFLGIYNYYNIGAYSGAMDGLAWAAGFLRAQEKTTLYSTYNESTGKAGGTKTSIEEKQYMSYIGTYGDYFKVRLYNETSSGYTTGGKVGYVKSDKLRTKYFNYGRPWTDPYICIKYGAQYISESYIDYQYTGYLQKFNVNPKSPSMYSHEYMANVDAAAAESVTTYNAYKTAGILSDKKIFYIPVFDDIQNNPQAAKVTGLKRTARSTDSLTMTWDKVTDATKYYIYIKNNTKGTNTYRTAKSNSIVIKNLTPGNSYSIKVKAYVDGAYGLYSYAYTTVTKPKTPPIKTPSTNTKHQITVKWSSVTCSGYQVQYARNKNFSDLIATRDVIGKSTTSYVGNNFTKGRKYYVRVRAFATIGSSRVYSSWSTYKTIVSK